MADRQLFCVIILSVLISGSALYMGYFTFVDDNKQYIQMHNWIRLCIFFAQHLITLGMVIKLLFQEQGEDIIKWIFQLSLIIVLTFIGGQLFTVFSGGRIFLRQVFVYRYSSISKSQQQQPTLQFQVNQITLYYQIMTDFAMFLVVSSIAMLVIKCKHMQQEQKYQFMIDNLKSEDFVDEPNVQEKKACAICLTDLDCERVLKVPCQHIFHKECLVNWLKRSTICPLCRTDIEQSLDPNSPLRSVGQAIPAPVIHQPIPELTFAQQPINVAAHINNPSSRRDMSQRVRSIDEGGLTERVVEERSVVGNNSRVSYNQEQVGIMRRENSNQLPPTMPIAPDNTHQPAAHQQTNNNPYTPRRRQSHSTRIFGDQNTSRSIYLPSPASQRSINFRFNSTSKSQPLIKVYNESEDNKQQQNVPSLENIPFESQVFYPNPNQKFVQKRNFTNSNQADNQRINHMLREQINP